MLRVSLNLRALYGFAAALLLRPGTTYAARASIFLQNGIVRSACSCKLAVFLDKNLDGDTRKGQRQHPDGDKYDLQIHTTKVRKGV